jgi:hypothetical protein
MYVELCLSRYGKRVFENRVLKEIFGSKRAEATGGWKIIIICTPRKIFYIDLIKDKAVEGTCNTNGRELRKKFWYENVNKGDH